jgi:ribonuclease R
VKIKLLEFFERELDRKPRTRFAAVITDVRQHGCFIELIESMTFGFIATANLRDDHLRPEQHGAPPSSAAPQAPLRAQRPPRRRGRRVDRFKRLIDFRPAE